MATLSININIAARLPQNGDFTLSIFNVTDTNGKNLMHCNMVELPWNNNQHQISCIPCGIYRLTWAEMADHPNHFHYKFLNVPNRDGIFLHYMLEIGAGSGNQSKGCPTLGNNIKQLPDTDEQILDAVAQIAKFEALYYINKEHQDIMLQIQDCSNVTKLAA